MRDFLQIIAYMRFMGGIPLVTVFVGAVYAATPSSRVHRLAKPRLMRALHVAYFWWMHNVKAPRDRALAALEDTSGEIFDDPDAGLTCEELWLRNSAWSPRYANCSRHRESAEIMANNIPQLHAQRDARLRDRSWATLGDVAELAKAFAN